jgi:hypothetical protein
MPQCSVQALSFDGSYIYAAVNSIGIFKWLYIKPQSTTLLKIMPVTRGFQVHQMLQTQADLLVCTSGQHLLKYDQT